MNSKIDQKYIYNTVWAACDTFRGVVDPAQYKEYILVMLFVKYISDVWRDHYEEYRGKYGGNDSRIRRKLERDRGSEQDQARRRFPLRQRSTNWKGNWKR